ncbi:acetaldehyde dehydrogenase (acetylating) [Clostridium sp. AWRP]|uniref:acetaldehyde dehydrogenase (acetylating) n=1 Tax=Clostridium sp. AWRP TaxID=2212991 RepID=UPI000FDC78B4|nr:acetaldehyde dehydrogenase (acetylating) [Clostridium sp. AWRP]AZV58033.1 acetaldehyde dehydrogenase (acetylating) [Clostridium sp. AWRP]
MENMDRDLQSIQDVRRLVQKARQAQQEYCKFSQEKMNKIIEHVAESAGLQAERLAKLAVEETTFGNLPDKIIKNKFASEIVYENIKDIKLVGILKDDKDRKILEIGSPVGVIAGLVPSTNPTSTVIYKSLIALKSGNAIVFSPHPKARHCIAEAIKVVSDAAVKAGAPLGMVSGMSILTMEGTHELMKNVDLILATGGSAMVKAAYSSGTPAIGVGPGNGPAFIEKTADIKLAVKRIMDSKTFDNGVICASEQSIVVEKCIKDKVVDELKRQGAYFLSKEQSEKVAKFILRANGTMNPQIVGKSAQKIAEMAGITVDLNARILISEQTTVGKDNPFSREKLTTILAFYCEENWEKACERCIELLNNEGIGHTLIIHSNNEEIVKEFGLKKPVSRILVNTPGSLGGIGATTNLVPALTLGCGAVGGSATSDNVGPRNLINIRRVAYGVREIEDIKKLVNNCNDRETSHTVLDISDQYVELITKKIAEKLSL